MKKPQPSTKEQTMETTIINFRTKDWVKREFFQLCSDQNVTATARLNDYMRMVLMENGVQEPTRQPKQQQQKKTDNHSVEIWRDELVTRTF